MSIILVEFFFVLNILFSFLKTVKFGVTLFVKDLGGKGKSAFKFRQTEAMTKAKWNLLRKDMVINYITEETMLVEKESKMPWRGPREKDARFLQFFIEGCSDEEDVVLDCTAATGQFMLSNDNSKVKCLFLGRSIEVLISTCLCGRCIDYCMSWHRTAYRGFGEGREYLQWGSFADEESHSNGRSDTSSRRSFCRS